MFTLTVVNEETKDDYTKDSNMLLFNGFKIDDSSLMIKSNNSMLIVKSEEDLVSNHDNDDS